MNNYISNNKQINEYSQISKNFIILHTQKFTKNKFV